MATSLLQIESLNTHLMCPVHLDMFKRPKTLPCQHVVCEECIEEWVRTTDGQLICPECRIVQPLPRDGVKGLPSNFKIASLCEFVESLMKTQDKPDIGACEKHLKKPVAEICLVCQIPVCEDCIKISHQGHKSIAIEEFVKSMGDPLPKLISQAKVKLQEIFRAVELIGKTRVELKENHKHAKKECDDHVHKLVRTIMQAQVNLKGDIERVYGEKEAALIIQLESLSRDGAEISELLAFQQQSEEDSSSSESIMTTAGQQMWNKLEQLLQQKPKLAPEHNGVMSIQWDKELEKVVGRETLGDVMTQPVPSNRHSTLSLSSSRVTVYSVVKILVALRDVVGNAVEITDATSISATIIAPGGFTGHVMFSSEEGGSAEARFTPKYIGKYKIEVKMFGNSVKNSPLNLIAKPRGELKFNHKPGFNNPHDIIKHEDNFIITDKSYNRVAVMDTNFGFVGKFIPPSDTGLQQIEPYAIANAGKTFVVTDLKNHCVLEFFNSAFLQSFGQDILSQPTGIACSKSGKVYVADGQKHCIFVFDQLRDFIAVLGGPGSTKGQLQSPWFLAVNSKGEVVVADHGNHRIQVFADTDEVTRLIDIHWDQKVWDCRGLAVDRNDNIYVSVRQSGSMRGFSTETVIVYSPEGVCLGNFGNGFNYVRGLTVIEDEENTIAVVVDGANHRIKGYLL